MRQLSLVENTPPGDVEQRLEDIANGIETVQATAIIKIGERLAEARDLFRYDRREGGFTGWVERRLNISYRTALNMILAFEQLGESARNSAHFHTLSKEALFHLAAPSTPEEVRIEVEQLLIDGQKVTAADIKKLKEEFAKLSASATESARTVEELTKKQSEAPTPKPEPDAAPPQSTQPEPIALNAASSDPSVLTRENIDLRQQLIELRAKYGEPQILVAAAANVTAFPAQQDQDPDVLVTPRGRDAFLTILGGAEYILFAQTTPEEFWRYSQETPGSREQARKLLFDVNERIAQIVRGYDQ